MVLNKNFDMQKLFRFLFKALSILVVDFVISLINMYVVELDRYFSPPIVTAIGMVIVLFLFFILFSYIEKFTNLVLRITISMGRMVPWRGTAIYLILALLYTAVYIGYYFTWFERFPPFIEKIL